MLTLGIETSCDETSCAVLQNSDKLLSNVISSSLAKHQEFGGVVPEIASRMSLEVIHLVYEKALKEAGVTPEKIDLVAVTQGPGLIGSLLVGVSFAKALSFSLEKPLVGVHHLQAHLLCNFISRKRPKKPFMGLVVSGGHTSILRVDGLQFKELGSTIDDAIGEAYDKVAKILGLGYPGGPVVDRLAKAGNLNTYRFTSPKVDGKYDFSFSGIKTAVLNLVAQSGSQKWRGQKLQDLCASFQKSVTDWVVQKLFLACEDQNIRSIAIGGGVSANSRLRALLEEECKLRGYELFIPPFALTLDNAGMIARMGYELYQHKVRSDMRLTANPNLGFQD